MRRVLAFVAALFMFAAASPAHLDAQASDSVAFAPGVRVSHAQAASIDSLVKAYRSEADLMRADGRDEVDGITTPERHALHERYREAIRAVLTTVQRSSYDAWYASALERHQRKGTTG